MRQKKDETEWKTRMNERKIQKIKKKKKNKRKRHTKNNKQ